MEKAESKKNRILEEYELMGFDRAVALQAWNKVNGDESRMLETALHLYAKSKETSKESTHFDQEMGGICSKDIGSDRNSVFQDYFLNKDIICEILQGSEYNSNFLLKFGKVFLDQERLNIEKEEQSAGSDQIQTVSTNWEHGSIFMRFFGKQRQFRCFTQQDEYVMDESELTFGPLLVSASHRGLENALEKLFYFKNDNYKLPNGEITRVEGETWITMLPDLVWIQLDRTDKEKNQRSKKKDKFTFEKEIYLDRFMIENRDQATEINNTITKLRIELDEKEHRLQKITDCSNRGLSAIEVLGFAHDCLQSEADSDQIIEDEDFIAPELAKDDEIKITLRTIKAYQQHFERQRDTLKQRIIQIKEEIHTLSTKFNEHKYQLVSIVIHNDDSGYDSYYSFNRNIQNRTWDKFDGFRVENVTEEQVMTEAIGGYSNKAAYGLIYMSDSLIQEELGSQKSTATEMQNNKADEVNHHLKSNPRLEHIINLYKAHFDALSVSTETFDPRGMPTNLDTFCQYLKSKTTEGDYLFKLYLIETVLQDSHEKVKPVDLAKTSPELAQALKEALGALPKPYTLKHVAFSQAEEDKIAICLSEYRREYLKFIYIKVLITSFLEERWKDGLDAARKLFENEKDPRSYYYKVVLNIARLGCIKLALLIEKYIRINQIGKALEAFHHLNPIAKGLLKEVEIPFLQVKTIVDEAIQKAQERVTKEEYKRLKEEADKLSTRPHSIKELDNFLANFSSSLLQEEIEQSKHVNSYESKGVPSTQINKLMDEVRTHMDIFVDLYNNAVTRKTPLKERERLEMKYILR